MKVLDLACVHGHVFEGWFGSEADYLDQRGRGLLECPMCGNAEVSKRLSAPRLNLGNTTPSQTAESPVMPSSSAVVPGAPAKDQGALLAAAAAHPEWAKAWMEVAKRVLANTTDVGDQFADEARKQHYGETKERGIRGRATPEQTQELLEEGIAVMPLPLPEALKGPLQ